MHLAQLNIAETRYDLESPEMADFVTNLEPVNATAEASPGFIWRLQDETGDATSIQAFDNPNIIVNMSVWASVDSLKDFMYRTHHINFLQRKREWFTRPGQDTYVLWWIPQGHTPSVEEGVGRLTHLREQGDTPEAFTFKTNFTPADLS